MIFRGMGHAIKQACKQIFRNRAMTFASFFSITAMLLILGLFFIVIVNVNMVAEDAKRQFDTIQIYLLEETSEDAVKDMLVEFREMREVAKAQYLSKEDALKEFKVKWGDKAYLLDGLSKNPLPNSLRVKVKDIREADAVVEKAKGLEGVEDIRYYQSTVDKLIRITDLIKIGATVVIVFLVVISVVIVSNTVKLTVLAREREISIMKYVGATNWFIRGPFLVEGMIIGFFSAGLAVGLVSLLYHKMVVLFSQDAFLMFRTTMVPEPFLIRNLVYIFVALGVSIGAIGSIISMRRFLDT